MDYLKLAVVSVTRTMGREIREDTFVQYFSYKRGWLSPSDARKLFKICVDAKLLKKEGDYYVQNFEFRGVIPLDFKITKDMIEKYTPREDVLTLLLDRICEVEGIERREALMRVNRVKGDLKYVTIDVAALIYCRERGIDCEEFYDEVEKKLVSS